MSDKMERETMQKFFDYIKAYNYVPSRTYAPPSHYDMQPYSSYYPLPLAAPTHLPKEASFAQPRATFGNPNFADCYKNNTMHDYTAYKQSINSMPINVPKFKNPHQNQVTIKGTQISRGPSTIDPSKSSLQSHPQISAGSHLYQMHNHNYTPSYRYPYMSSAMNPYNPYYMYPPYYYNRPQMYAGNTNPYQFHQKPQTENSIKQEIVISSDSEENPVNTEYGYKKKNRMGYTVYANQSPVPQEKTSQLINKPKQKQFKGQLFREKEHQNSEKQKAVQKFKLKSTNTPTTQKLLKQGQDQIRVVRAYKYPKFSKQYLQKNDIKPQIKQVQEPKDMEMKRVSKQIQIKSLEQKLKDKQQQEDNAQSKAKSNLKEDQPFYIKKKRIVKQIKHKKDDCKSQTRKRQRQKDNQIMETLRRNRNEQNSNKEFKGENFYEFCQKIASRNSLTAKTEPKKHKMAVPEKEEKQNSKRERVKDDHPLRQLRYSESHGRIRLGPYYQSSIPSLLSGSSMVAMQKQLQLKLRERQISAITF